MPSPLRRELGISTGAGVLGGALLLVLTSLYGPWGNALSDWVQDTFDVGKTSATVVARPVLHPCDAPWALPPDRYAAADRDYQRGEAANWPGGGLTTWVKQHGAVAHRSFLLYLDIASTSTQKATLHDIRVKVTRRGKAPALVPFRSRCGGPGIYRSLRVPLHALPVGRAVSVREMYERWPDEVAVTDEERKGDHPDMLGAERARSLRLPLTMASDDPETVRIDAVVERGYVEWELQLVWAVAGEEAETHTVDFAGDPFRIASDAAGAQRGGQS